MLLTSLIPKHMYSYISENNFKPSNQITVPTGYTINKLYKCELNLLLQSALQPLWVLACSTIVEYSQQEGFYRVLFPAARQTPQPGGPVIRTFQLPPPGVPHVWNDVGKPQQWKVELWARNGWEFCWKWRLPHHFWVLLHAAKFMTWDRRLYFPSEGRSAEDFLPEKSDGFGRVWTHKHGYQRPTCLPLDHRSCELNLLTLINVIFAIIYILIYDIFVNCYWDATQWQQYSTHLHTNNTQNDTKLFGRAQAVSRLCELYPGICLTTEEKAQKYQKALVVRCPLVWSEKLKTKCSGCVVEFHTAAICGATALGPWLLSLWIFGGVSKLQALDW